MLIYVAFFAGAVAAAVLAAVYLSDRYEREPLNAVQDAFLAGALAQAVAVVALLAITHRVFWDGWWVAATLVGLVVAMPGQLRRCGEVDERFDGIVYTVSTAAGALCVIHLANLPTIAALSPHRAALGTTATPDLRDLLIIAGSPGFAGELGAGVVLVALAVLAGAVIGHGHQRAMSPWRVSLTALAVTGPVFVVDVLSHGQVPIRAAIALAAIVVAAVVKGRSVFRAAPRTTEPEALKLGLKTLLIVFGTCLLIGVLFSALGGAPAVPPEGPTTFENRP
jgi:hypothetical protein